MRNIKLTIEYDGTAFHGWQWQPDVRTIQGEIESSLKTLLREEIRIIGSGRTDVGVHALGQVANFHTQSRLDLKAIQKGLNSLLPEDIVILKVEEVDEKFHARYDAKRRKYRYMISKRPRAVNRHYCWYCKYPLDLEKIRQASAFLIGEHDFQAFCQAEADVKHHLCKVESIIWTESEDNIVLEILANRFLHNMVRIIVGTMVEVGKGKITVEEVERILKARDRRLAGKTVPAKGLCLVEVQY